MKVIIAGSRLFNDYDKLRTVCNEALKNQSHVEIISGRCSSGTKTFITDDGIAVFGADGLGEKYAKEKGYTVLPFPADWSKYGKSAGPRRNAEMAKNADALIAFWDGNSSGTKNMIDLANSAKLKVKVIK